MSAPASAAPLVVNTRDGMCWTRRTVTSSGIALYAPEGVCSCPEFVMATLPELAELGISGSADALPMPAGSAPQVVRRSAAEVRLEQYGSERKTYGNASEKALHHIALDLRKELSDQRAYEQRLREQHDLDVAEVNRLRAERDEFCNRVDTLTAVAQGNKRHVVSLTVECQRLAARVAELEAERHSTNEALDDAVQALRARPVVPEREPEFHSSLHHDYRVGHDLPETGGAS